MIKSRKIILYERISSSNEIRFVYGFEIAKESEENIGKSLELNEKRMQN